MKKSVTTKLDPELYNYYKESAGERGISMSEWLSNAAMCYYYWLNGNIEDYEESEYITEDEIDDMGWDELVDLIESEELDIDPMEYRNFFGRDTESLRDAVLIALFGDEDTDTDEDIDEDTDEDTDED